MKRFVASAVACAVVGLVVAAPAIAGTYPNARVVVPTAGYALTGDSDPSGEYRNFGGQNNYVTTPTLPNSPYELRIDWQAGRRLFLNITSNQSNVAYPPITYTCVTGPEDPYKATNRNTPALGAAFYLTRSLIVSNIQCYNAAHDAGYWVDLINEQSCMTVTKTASADPRFPGGDHYTIDGP